MTVNVDDALLMINELLLFIKNMNFVNLGLGTHLFFKVPRPGNSKGTFWSSSQAATCYYQSYYSKIEAIP